MWRKACWTNPKVKLQGTASPAVDRSAGGRALFRAKTGNLAAHLRRHARDCRKTVAALAAGRGSLVVASRSRTGLAGLAEAGADGGTDRLVRISSAPTQAGCRIRHNSSPLNSRRTHSSAGHASAQVSR